MRRSGLFTLFKFIVIFKLIFAPFRQFTLWFLTETKAGRIFEYYYAQIIEKFVKLNHFVRTFIISISAGLLAFAFFVLASKVNFKPVIEIKNYVFDSTLTVFTEFSRKDKYMRPVFIAYDEESYQDQSWVKSKSFKPSIQLNNSIIQLVDKAYANGSHHVFIDFALTDYNNDIKPIMLTINNLVTKYKNSKQPHHLYVVISTQPDECLKDVDYYQRIESSVWQHIPLKNNNFYIHPVSPTVYESEDKVVRNWSLFGVSQLYVSAEGASTAQWTFLPSPQLAYHVVSHIEQSPNQVDEKLSALPWLSIFESDPNRLVRHTSRSQYIENTYQRLISLTHSQQLQSYCSKSSSVCIPPHYIKRQQNLKKLRQDRDKLFSQLAYKNSANCQEKIDAFTETFQEAPVSHDILENKIIYSMKTWTESKQPDVEANYDLITPKELFDPLLHSNHQDWGNQYVAIGAGYQDSRDNNYATPIGPMPGVLININAVNSFESFGAIGLISPLQRFLLNLGVICLAGLLFAKFRVGDATIIILLCIIILVLFFHEWMFEHGIWIEFGLPLFVMNLVSFVLQKREDILDEISFSRLQAQAIETQTALQLTDDQLKIAELKLELLKRTVALTPWDTVLHENYSACNDNLNSDRG